MTSAQVVEMSVTNNSSSQNYTHPDDHTTRTTDTPGFKPFTKFVTHCITKTTTFLEIWFLRNLTLKWAYCPASNVYRSRIHRLGLGTCPAIYSSYMQWITCNGLAFHLDRVAIVNADLAYMYAWKIKSLIKSALF